MDAERLELKNTNLETMTHVAPDNRVTNGIMFDNFDWDGMITDDEIPITGGAFDG